MHTAIVSLILGIILLLLGRKLFWFFVGAAGFLLGLDLTERFFAGTDMTKLVIALVIGIICAFLAILFYKVAVAIGGFFIGVYLALHLVSYLGIPIQPSMTWVAYLIGGIIGAILILVLFDWALIVLSSFAGASLILHSVLLPRVPGTIAYVVLVVIGILFQARIFYRSRRTTT